MSNKGVMPRSKMIDVIRGGGSILHDGRIHISADTLPGELELASTDQEKAAAVEDINAQIERLQRQKEDASNRSQSLGSQIIESLGDCNLIELIGIAEKYGITDAADFESRVQLISAIREKAGDPSSGGAPAPTVTIANVPALKGTPEPAAKNPSEQETLPQPQTTDPNAALRKLTVDQLKAVAKESGVADYDKLSKQSDLIDAIVARTTQRVAQASAQAGS